MRWLVWCLDYDESEDDATVLHGIGPDDVAEAWAERTDSDFNIVKVLVGIRRESGGPIIYRYVSGESVPNYTASKPSLEWMRWKLAQMAKRRAWRQAGRFYGMMHEVFA